VAVRPALDGERRVQITQGELIIFASDRGFKLMNNKESLYDGWDRVFASSRSSQQKSTQRTSRTGRRILSDIVQNVVFIGDNRELHQAIIGQETYKQAYPKRSYTDLYFGLPILSPGTGSFASLTAFADKSEPVELNGWIVHKEIVQVGRKKALRAHILTSGDMEIYAVNIVEDMVGLASVSRDYCVFSPNRQAVESFLKDFDIQAEIEDMDAVCQSI